MYLPDLTCVNLIQHCYSIDFPDDSVGKKYACNAGDTGDMGSIPGDQEDPLEKEMATHSSILAWRLPWTEEPGGLQSMGSQRAWEIPWMEEPGRLQSVGS